MSILTKFQRSRSEYRRSGTLLENERKKNGNGYRVVFSPWPRPPGNRIRISDPADRPNRDFIVHQNSILPLAAVNFGIPSRNLAGAHQRHCRRCTYSRTRGSENRVRSYWFQTHPIRFIRFPPPSRPSAALCPPLEFRFFAAPSSSDSSSSSSSSPPPPPPPLRR